ASILPSFEPSAVIAAVTSWRPNFARSALTSPVNACGPLVSQVLPQAFGYSQSMSMPSKTPAQRGSLTRLKQDSANAAGFFAASVNPADQVQPPKDQSTF